MGSGPGEPRSNWGATDCVSGVPIALREQAATRCGAAPTSPPLPFPRKPARLSSPSPPASVSIRLTMSRRVRATRWATVPGARPSLCTGRPRRWAGTAARSTGLGPCLCTACKAAGRRPRPSARRSAPDTSRAFLASPFWPAVRSEPSLWDGHQGQLHLLAPVPMRHGRQQPVQCEGCSDSLVNPALPHLLPWAGTGLTPCLPLCTCTLNAVPCRLHRSLHRIFW